MSPNTTLILASIVGFGIAISSALRGALTAQVPPGWLKLAPRYRPLAASLVSALLTFLLTVQAGEGWAHALAAALVVLGASLSKLIAAEGDAAGAKSSAVPAPIASASPTPAPAPPPATPGSAS